MWQIRQWQDNYSTKTCNELLHNVTTFDTSEYGRYLMSALQISSDLNFEVLIRDCNFVVIDDEGKRYDLTYHCIAPSFKQLFSLIEKINSIIHRHVK